MTAAHKGALDRLRKIAANLRSGHCAPNTGCGTMKVCVCAYAEDAAEVMPALIAVAEAAQNILTCGFGLRQGGEDKRATKLRTALVALDRLNEGE